MLIVHASSTCDICLEPFLPGADARPPCAIQCGHVFCRPCIEALTKLLCPLCRAHFDPRSVRRLHVDLASTPHTSPPRPPAHIPTADDPAASDADALKARLVDMIREGANAARFQALLAELTSWLSLQPKD
ncbi:hypothetical protein K488DRAFT_7517, partial [Vararia minispora EC-137]